MRRPGNEVGSDSYQFLFLFRIPYLSEEKNDNDEPVCQTWNSQQTFVDQNNWTTSRDDPEYSGRKKPTEISGISAFGIIANIGGLHGSMHCSMASEVIESFLNFFRSINYM